MAKTFQFDFVINGLVNRNFSGTMTIAQKGLINIGKESQALKGKLKELDKELYAGQIDFEGYADKANKAKAQLKALELQQLKLNKAVAARQHLKSAAMEFSGLALGVYAASRPIVGMINVAAEFEETMSRVKAITRANTVEMEQLTAEAKRLGRVTPFTAKQSAEAMTYLGMAGWETSQILKGMPGLLNLAMAGKTDLARTADIISDDLTAFGLGAEKAQHMADVFAYTITRTNTNVEMLGETMKYAAPVAHAFGASMEETAALAGLMANGAIKATQAGTSLRMGLLRLAGPPKKASKALDELGISISDATKEQQEAQAAIKSLGIDMKTAEGNARPMLSIVKELREKLNQLGKPERLAMAANIFGVHASSAWLNVFDAPAEKFAELVGEMEKADGAADEFAKTATNNARGALTRLQSATEGVALAIGSVFLPALADAAGGAAHYAGIIGDVAEKHPVLIKTIGTVGVAMAGTALAVKAAGVIYAAYQVAATAATAGTWAFNTALLANPIGLVVVGIAGLVAAGYTLYKNWDTVSASLVKGWAWVKDTAQGVHAWFMTALSQLPEKAGFAVGYVIGWFMQLPGKLLGVIPSLTKVGISFVEMASEWGKLGVKGIIDSFLSLPGKLTGIISSAWESAKNAIGSFSVSVERGVNASGANGAAAAVAANARGGIYSKGAFLTTFAEESPEAAIPIDNSDRAKSLWLRTGQMLGMIQKPQRRSTTPILKLPGTFPANTGFEQNTSLPKLNIPDSIKAVGKLTANLSVPGVFGALVKWLQRPGKKDGEPGGLPAFPVQPAPIINAMAATPNVQVAPAVSNIAPVINAMVKAPDVAVNPPTVTPVFNALSSAPVINVPSLAAPVVSPVIQAMASAPNVSPVFNPLVNVPKADTPQVKISQSIQALAKAPAVSAIFDPVVQPAGMPDIDLPDLPVQKETLIERIREFVKIPATKQAGEPKMILANIPPFPEMKAPLINTVSSGSDKPKTGIIPHLPEMKAPSVNDMLPGILEMLLNKVSKPEKKANIPKLTSMILPEFPDLPAPIINIGKAFTEKTAPVLNLPVIRTLHEVLQNQSRKKADAAPTAALWLTLQLHGPTGIMPRIMQAATPSFAGIVSATSPVALSGMTDGIMANGSGTETGKPRLLNLFSLLTSAFQRSGSLQNTGLVNKITAMPALQNAGTVLRPELAMNQPSSGPDLLQRIREFVQSPGENISNSNYSITYAPTIAPRIEIAGTTGKQEVMEAVKQATDISFEKFRQMMQKYDYERRRSSYS